MKALNPPCIGMGPTWPPCAHARGRGRVEQSASRQPPQDAKLHHAGQRFRVSSLEAGGLVTPDTPLDVAGDHAVEGPHVVVIVRVERTPKALRVGDGSELRVANRGRRARTRVKKRGPERPEENGEHPTRHLGRLVQEGPKPIGDGEHPLPGGKVGDHLVGQVGRHLRHASSVAVGALPPTLAGEGQESVVPTVRAAHPREPVGEDAEAQVAADFTLHLCGDPPVHGVGVLRLNEKRLQMMLVHRVEGRLRGAAGAVDPAENWGEPTGWGARDTR